ncbi:e9imm peptide [Streptomyces sp. NPDC058695]|uniref:e9imm peptide n=1 Tax=Streptomyces sp. NPDC058695 TaxID=3346604 RepID=UPI0036688F5A
MGAVELSRAEAVALVQRILEADYASEGEVNDWLDRLARALACPSGHVSGLVFWPPQRELSAEEVVDHALAYRPIAL